MKSTFLFLAFFFAVALSKITYDIQIAQNGQCSQVQEYGCVQCKNATGQVVSYYAYGYSSSVSVYVNQYSDPYCSYWVGGYYASEESCSSSAICQITFTAEVTYYSLTVSSDYDLALTFLSSETNLVSLASSKAVVNGDVKGIVFKASNDEVLRVEQVVSATQFSTNLGVFPLNEENSAKGFTFEMSVETASSLPTPSQTPSNLIVLSPFLSVYVSNENEYDFIYEYGEMGFFLDNYDLSGVQLSNPYFSITNMTFYPVYDNNDYGYVVFQFSSGDPYHTVPCYHSDSGIQIYDCEFGSLSFSGVFGSFGSFSGSFGSFGSFSFSFDEPRHHQKQQPDNMAFNLF